MDIPTRPAAFFGILLTVSVLSACAIDVKDRGKSWYYPGLGASVVLHEPVTFEPGTASVFFQHGESLGNNHNYFEPYCRLVIRDISDAPYQVAPDTFRITRSNHYMDMFTSIPVRLAAARVAPEGLAVSDARPLLVAGSDAPSDVTETIQMALSSPRQPNVIRLECGGARDHPADAVAPTLAEMKEALGDIMSFRDLP